MINRSTSLKTPKHKLSKLLDICVYKEGFNEPTAFIDYWNDLDSDDGVKGLNYYAKRWGFGKNKTIRIIGDATEAINLILQDTSHD